MLVRGDCGVELALIEVDIADPAQRVEIVRIGFQHVRVGLRRRRVVRGIEGGRPQGYVTQPLPRRRDRRDVRGPCPLSP